MYTFNDEVLCIFYVRYKGKVCFLLGGRGVGRGILETFCQKSRGPPTSLSGLMHDPLKIPTQKHLTLPPPLPRQK